MRSSLQHTHRSKRISRIVYIPDTASSVNEHISHSLSQSSFDSNQSLIGSATNANDLDIYFSSRIGGPPESDVEILSNPSISTL